MKKQLEQQQSQISLQREQLKQQGEQNQHQLEAILQSLQVIAKSNDRHPESTNSNGRQAAEIQQNNISVPKFDAFDPLKELWSDYNLRFQTFVKAHSVPESKVAQIFLTN